MRTNSPYTKTDRHCITGGGENVQSLGLRERQDACQAVLFQLEEDWAVYMDKQRAKAATTVVLYPPCKTLYSVQQ